MEVFKDIPAQEVKDAAHAAWEELAAVRRDVQKKGEETLEYLEKTGRRGIVLAGRPYHIDPEIHHGIPDLINSYGIAVLTEDSVSHLAQIRASRSVSTTSGCIIPVCTRQPILSRQRIIWISSSLIPSAAAWTPLLQTRFTKFWREAARSIPA